MSFRSLVSFATIITVGGVLANQGTAWADTASGPYIGAQLGLGDNRWYDEYNPSVAGGVNAGYDFNQYIAAELGYNYLGDTQAVDLVGKIHVPVIDNFGLFAKTGVGYLRRTGGYSSAGNVNLVYGFGGDYKITPHLITDVSFTRFNGNSKESFNYLNNYFNTYSLSYKNYLPNADLYAVGLTYKFNP